MEFRWKRENWTFPNAKISDTQQLYKLCIECMIFQTHKHNETGKWKLKKKIFEIAVPLRVNAFIGLLFICSIFGISFYFSIGKK